MIFFYGIDMFMIESKQLTKIKNLKFISKYKKKIKIY
jgi:hypothetical protein